MNPLKWIELAATDGDYRPAMSWAFQSEILGEPVTLACDVYRLHWVYRQDGFQPIIPLKHSEDLSAAENWAQQLPTRMSGLLDAQVGARFSIRAQALKQAFRIARAVSEDGYAIRMIYDPAGQLRVFASGSNGDSLSSIPVRPLGIERGKPLSAAVNSTYMLEALRLFTDSKTDQVVEVQFGAWVNRDSRCIIIGQADKAFALIMQMDVKPMRNRIAEYPFIQEWLDAPRI